MRTDGSILRMERLSVEKLDAMAFADGMHSALNNETARVVDLLYIHPSRQPLLTMLLS